MVFLSNREYHPIYFVYIHILHNMATRAPKQWCLGQNETISSYESWKNNLIHCLSLDQNYAPFLEATWERKSRNHKHRAFTDDGAEVPHADRRSSTQKRQHRRYGAWLGHKLLSKDIREHHRQKPHVLS